MRAADNIIQQVWTAI